MAGQAGAGDTVGVADGDGAAVDVEFFHRDAQLVAAVDDLGSEGFVQFPQVDVVHGQAVALEQLRNGIDRADAHFVRLATGDAEAAEDTDRLDVLLLGGGAVHDNTDGRAVRQLAGVAGGDEVLWAANRLQALQGFQRGAGAVALVLDQVDFLLADFAGFLVLDQHLDGVRHDLVVELAAFLTGCGALLADQGILVLGLAGDVVAGGDDVGCLDHRHVQVGLVVLDPLVGAVEHVQLVVLAQADGLDATGDDGRNLFADDALSGDGDGLQTGAAEAVDRHAGGGHRQTGADRGQTGHVLALGAFVEGRAEDTVFHQRWIDAGTLDGVFDNISRHIDTVGVVQGAAVGLAQRGTRGRDDNCIRHCVAPVSKTGRDPPGVTGGRYSQLCGLSFAPML